jgi:hypothetical protein
MYPNGNKTKILETQKNLILAYFKELGYTENDQKSLIKTLFHQKSLDDITVVQATRLLNDLTTSVNTLAFRTPAKSETNKGSHKSAA